MAALQMFVIAAMEWVPLGNGIWIVDGLRARGDAGRTGISGRTFGGLEETVGGVGCPIRGGIGGGGAAVITAGVMAGVSGLAVGVGMIVLEIESMGTSTSDSLPESKPSSIAEASSVSVSLGREETDDR